MVVVGACVAALAWLVGAQPRARRARLHAVGVPRGRRQDFEAPVRTRSADPTDLVAVIEQMSGLTRAGASLATALSLVVSRAGADRVGDALRDAAAACAAGAPVPPVLRRCPELTGLAATWEVVLGVGAPAGNALERLAKASAADLDAAQAVAAVLAGPKATARLLVALPPVAVLLGEAMGAASMRVLASTGVGQVCVLVGLLGLAAGWAWSRRLIAEAMR